MSEETKWKSPTFSEAVGGLTSIIGAVGSAYGAKTSGKYQAQEATAQAAALQAQAAQAAEMAALEKEEQEAKNKRMLIIGGTAAGVVALIVLAMVAKRK